MKIVGLLAPVLMVCSAAVVRTGTDPITVIRTVGQQVQCNVTVIASSTQTSASMDIGYDPDLVAPVLPGGPVNGVTLTVTTPGNIHLAWAGATQADGDTIYTLAFRCLRAGTTAISITNATASDPSGAIPVIADSKDTLKINPKPVTIKALLQP